MSVARWLLVPVVAFDFLSAPCHHHHQDGVEGQLEFSTAHVSFEAGDTHVETDDHPLGSHAATAIRIDQFRPARLPPIDNADAQNALVSAAQLLTAVDELVSRQWCPDRFRPDFRSYRSLLAASLRSTPETFSWRRPGARLSPARPFEVPGVGSREVVHAFVSDPLRTRQRRCLGAGARPAARPGDIAVTSVIALKVSWLGKSGGN